MSGDTRRAWWRPGSGGAPVPADDPPANLRQLPPAPRAGEARRESAARDPAATARDRRVMGLALDEPGKQRGCVKIWRARSVDLRRLLAHASWVTPPAADTSPPPAGGGAAGAGRGETAPPKPDGLARRLAARLQPPPEFLLSAGGVLAWPGELFPYQRDGTRALLESPRLLLGDEMGLGKTVMAIAALRLLLFRQEIERALVVVPAGLLDQWRRELHHWAPELRVMTVAGPPGDRAWQWRRLAHVTLTSYDILRADAAGGAPGGPYGAPWDVVVLDEAQKIKNRDADVSRACKRLPRHRSWALTGTPLENRQEDLASILEFVRGGDGRAPLLLSGPALRATLNEFQLRRRKAEVLQDLPPKIVTELTLPLTPPQREAYDRAEQEGIVALRQGSVRIENVLALITRLKQICNFDPRSGASAKMSDLIARLEEVTGAGHKALVFTQYAGDDSGARRIAARLARFAPLVFTGDTALAGRSAIVARFREEGRRSVLVLSLKAGGQGLNLQSASYVFHFDRWWNPATERQAEDRAHRLGQTQPVHVYKYITADTIEQRIDEILKGKTDLFEQLVEGASLDLSRLLTKQELLGLFGL